MEQELNKVLRKIEQEVRDGVRHGNFRLRVEVTTVQRGARRVIVEAGKSYKFDVPAQEGEAA